MQSCTLCQVRFELKMGVLPGCLWHYQVYCPSCLKDQIPMDRKSVTCGCIYCNENCRTEHKCVGCGACVCRRIGCAFVYSGEKGRGNLLKNHDTLCPACHHIRHGACFHCKKEIAGDAKEASLCCAQCQVCLKPTCGQCSLHGTVHRHSSVICKGCAAWESRSFHCPYCDALTDRKCPANGCSLCSRPVCTNEPENSKRFQCSVDDCGGELPSDLCCLHLSLTQECQKCGSTTHCGEHRIPCETCGRPAICAGCSPDLRTLWDSHDPRRDAATGMYAPMLLTQCKICQNATREVLRASKMEMDLQRLLYKTLFVE